MCVCVCVCVCVKVIHKVLSLIQILDLSLTSHFLWASSPPQLAQKSDIFSIIWSGHVLQQQTIQLLNFFLC